MSFVSEEIRLLVSEIADILIQKRQTIAISEAACGGILSAYLVSIPGASKFYQGGTLLYSLKSKLKLSGWSEAEIANYTGPSEYSVLKQSRNLKIELGSTYALCESGFAGPSTEVEKVSGGNEQNSDESKVGTVYFAISGPNGSNSAVKHTGMSDRVQNMEEFAKLGLVFLLEELKKI